MKLYHVTMVSFVDDILKEGLVLDGIDNVGGVPDSMYDFIQQVLPTRGNYTFLWPNLDMAERYAEEVAFDNPDFAYAVLEVDRSKIPCPCHTAPIEISSKIYDKMEPYTIYDVKDIPKEAFELLNRLGDEYQSYVKLLNEEDVVRDDVEIFCPCAIPGSAITLTKDLFYAPKELWRGEYYKWGSDIEQVRLGLQEGD